MEAPQLVNRSTGRLRERELVGPREVPRWHEDIEFRWCDQIVIGTLVCRSDGTRIWRSSNDRETVLWSEGFGTDKLVFGRLGNGGRRLAMILAVDRYGMIRIFADPDVWADEFQPKRWHRPFARPPAKKGFEYLERAEPLSPPVEDLPPSAVEDLAEVHWPPRPWWKRLLGL